jgi:hypothetical protein
MPSAPQTQPKMENLPVHTICYGRIKAAIWKNQTNKGDVYNVTVTRSFRDGDGWHDSQNFSYDDLMIGAKLLYDAHRVITGLRAHSNTANQICRDAPPRSPEERTRDKNTV